MPALTKLPRAVDTVVIGGGTAGAAVAGLLAQQSSESVLLLEAGPDYGSFASDHWPADLKDARALPMSSHDWGYNSGHLYEPRVIRFERARVIGGCSSHNGCAEIWGSRADYDHWAAALSEPAWSADVLLPLFRAAAKRLRVRVPPRDEITPFQLACLDAAPSMGIPHVADLNNLDEHAGMAPSPANIVDGVRWNTAFAYLDPVRDRPNLTIAGNLLIDRLTIRSGRVTEVIAIGADGPARINASRVVVAAGTFGSPAILMRSGIGDPAALASIGITPTHELAGVGRNLHDHPQVGLSFSGTPGLVQAMAAFAKTHWMPEEQTIAKTRSAHCVEAFDLHLYPVGGPSAHSPTGWYWYVTAACLTPRSRGTLRLESADPQAAPLIDHRFLSDPEGADLEVLVDGIEIARQLASQPALARLLGRQLAPNPKIRTDDEISNFIKANFGHYYHPVGTCRMGPASDREAVVDSRGKIHGLDNAFVADASIIPAIPRANTNMPALVVGERIGRWLCGL